MLLSPTKIGSSLSLTSTALVLLTFLAASVAPSPLGRTALAAAEVMAQTPPAAPTDFNATVIGPDQVDLSWTDNADNEDGFFVQRRRPGGSFGSVGSVDADITTFTDATVEANTTYIYQVIAYNGAGNSDPSNILFVTPGLAPAAPTGLDATATGPDRVDLSWIDNADNEDGFFVQRRLPGGSFGSVGSVDANITTLTDITVEAETTYEYRAIAYNGTGNSDPSNIATVTIPGVAPAAPTGLIATPTSPTQVELAWTDNADNEDEFAVDRRLEWSSDPFGEIVTLPADTTSFLDTDVSPATDYEYRVRAINTAGEALSTSAQVTTPDFLQLEFAFEGNGGFTLVIGDGPRPITVEWKRRLSDSIWERYLTTYSSRLTFPATAMSGFFRLWQLEVPLELHDHEQDRQDIAEFYHADPKRYWVFYGIPPLVRQSDMNEAAGLDPQDAFSALNEGFNETNFSSGFQAGLMPTGFSNQVQVFLDAGQGTNQAVNSSFRTLVHELDTVYELEGTNAPRVGEIFDTLDTVFTQAYETNGLFSFAPQHFKVFDEPVTNMNWVDLHGTDAFTLQVPPPPPNNPGDTDTSTRTAWTNITFPSWNTTYNGACAALKTGLSLFKLAPEKFPGQITCQFWNEFSRDIGADAGSMGAGVDEMAAYYAALGYGSTRAYDGPFETALVEADRALKRGCDVALYFVSEDGQESHIEFVEQIEIDPKAQDKATVHTLSWAQHESVNYADGHWSGKTDGPRYASGPGDWLSGSGRATFYYYCKE